MFFKGCPLRCRWCQNPESHQPGREMSFYVERCVACFTCQEVCPEKAILTGKDQRIDHSRCTGCGKCASACIYKALRTVGVEWEVPLLLEEVLKDRDYFDESGGGITLSGGEPILQGRFLVAFLPLVREQGLHVTLETCGLWAWETLEGLLPYLDLIYFDLKIMDAEDHRKYTGSPNGLILNNFEKLAGVFNLLIPRMVVIPTINDTTDNLRAVSDFLKKNQKEEIHLLRYHWLGESKLTRIATPLKSLNLKMDTQEVLDRAKTFFEQEGLAVYLY